MASSKTKTQVKAAQSRPAKAAARPKIRRRPLPVETRTALDTAVDADAYLIAVFAVVDGQVHLYRQAHRFPVGDVPVALELLKRDLEQLATDAA